MHSTEAVEVAVMEAVVDMEVDTGEDGVDMVATEDMVEGIMVDLAGDLGAGGTHTMPVGDTPTTGDIIPLARTIWEAWVIRQLVDSEGADTVSIAVRPLPFPILQAIPLDARQTSIRLQYRRSPRH
jgi:hypothetical protein